MNKQSIERENSGEGLLYEKFGTLSENLKLTNLHSKRYFHAKNSKLRYVLDP